MKTFLQILCSSILKKKLIVGLEFNLKSLYLEKALPCEILLLQH